MNLLNMNAMKLALPLCVALAYAPAQGLAAPILGSALKTFAVLGATGVTNVATSTIGGNLGSAPTASVDGGVVFSFGSLQQNTALAQQAQLDLDAAILDLADFGVGFTILNGDLDVFQASNGNKINPGVYTVPSATVNLTGELKLDGGGSNSAVFVFQFPSTFITGSSSKIRVVNAGDGANVGVYFNVGTAATLDGPLLSGNVLARTIGSSDGNLTIPCGRLLASEAQVTLIKDNISIGCEEFGARSGGFDQGSGSGAGAPSVVPEPGTLALFGLALAGLFAFRKRSIPVA